MNKAKKQTLVVGVLILVVSVIAFIMTFQMPHVDAYRYPRMVIILFFVLGVVLVHATLKGKFDSADNSAPIQVKKSKNTIISFLIVIGYAVLINVIGFYTSTTVFSLVFMKFLGAKSWKKMLLITFCSNLFVYLLFSYQFMLPLPRGIAI